MNNQTAISEELKAWILEQQDSRYTVERACDDKTESIILKTDSASATITLYSIEYTICELRVVDAKQENVFYLHFELNDLDHAKGLFLEMKESLLKQKTDTAIHVLLCCTCGLTTSYFTMNLNESVRVMGMKMDFDAVPYDKLYESAQDKDVILIAPQIGYQLKNARAILSDKLVLEIPAALFSRYDVFGLINLIKDEYEKHEQSETVQAEGVQELVSTEGSTLILSVIDMEGRTQLAYRVYGQNEIVMQNQIVKERYRAEDIRDVIGSVLRMNQNIRTICLVSPGSFHEEKLTYEKGNIFNFDVRTNIEEKFGIRTLTMNDTDAIALGYSQKELNGEMAAFYFVPSGEYAGNIGISAYGRIFGTAGHMGGSQLAGITDITTFPKNPYALAKTPEGNVALCARYLTGLITYTGCSHIAFYAKMIPDTSELIQEIGKFIRPEYIPQIVRVNSVREYLYDGAMYYINSRKDS